MHRKLKFAGCLAMLSITASQLNAPAFAQEAAIKASEGAGNCQVYPLTIGKLEGGSLRGLIKSCANGIADVTVAPNGLRPDEMTIMSLGRYQNKQTPSFLRGKPNTAYLFHPLYMNEIAGRYLYDPKSYPLSDVAHVLPFMPTEIVSLGDLGNGQTGYGYTGLQFSPSSSRDAFPLNRDSIIIAVDGFNFVSPMALTAYLAQTVPTERAIRYVEIVYLQAGEKGQVFHRALIPLYPRALQEPAWSRMAANNSAFTRSWVDRNRTFIALTMFSSFAYLVAAYAESDAGRAAKAEHDQCMAERNPLTC